MPKRNRAKLTRRLVDVIPNDVDLQELLEVLIEGSATHKASETPWRSWVFATRFCIDVYCRAVMDSKDIDADAQDIFRFLVRLVNEANQPLAETFRANNYDRAIELEYVADKLNAPFAAVAALRDGLAIVRLGLARSDGGGAAFLGRLDRFVAQCEVHGVDVDDLVEKWRMEDALYGCPAEDRAKLERAFRTAWRRGLIGLAYAIHPHPHG